MKKPPSKTDLRERLQRQTAAFLSSGGKVKEFRAGESAYDRNETPPPHRYLKPAALSAPR